MSKVGIMDSKGFHLTFANGWTVSVQIGPGNYCDNYRNSMFEFYNNKPRSLESSNAEIAAWDKEGNWYKFSGDLDTVKGYVVPDKIAEFIAEIAAKE